MNGFCSGFAKFWIDSCQHKGQHGEKAVPAKNEKGQGLPNRHFAHYTICLALVLEVEAMLCYRIMDN